jgi:uncharacterized protein (TIGR02145 family)
MKHNAQFFLVVFLSGSLIAVKGQEVVKDYDGNVYKTVKTGTRVWMAENLKVTHYRNGEPIPNIKEPKQWDIVTSAACCDLNNNPAYTKAFGLLYNWYAVGDVRNVCPTGWHVPSDLEWNSLTTILSGEKVPSGVLSGSATMNQSLFRFLPEGFRGYEGEFTGLGYGGGGWWTATECTAGTAFYHNVNYNTAGSQHMEGRKSFGYHIRCIKD